MFISCCAAIAMFPDRAHAGPSYSITFAPPPGNGGTYGDASYGGQGNYSAFVTVPGPSDGIAGTGTPSHAGSAYPALAIDINGSGETGNFQVLGAGGADPLDGTIYRQSITASGGTFDFSGYLSAAAADYFGVDPSTLLAGTGSIQLSTAPNPGAGGDDLAEVQLNFAPVPEPGSFGMVAVGMMAMVMGWGMRWKGRRRLVV